VKENDAPPEPLCNGSEVCSQTSKSVAQGSSERFLQETPFGGSVHTRMPTDSEGMAAIGPSCIYDEHWQYFAQSLHLFALFAVPGVGKPFLFTARLAPIVPQNLD